MLFGEFLAQGGVEFPGRLQTAEGLGWRAGALIQLHFQLAQTGEFQLKQACQVIPGVFVPQEQQGGDCFNCLNSNKELFIRIQAINWGTPPGP